MPKEAPIHAHRGALVERVDELAALYRLTDKLYRARSLTDVYDAALDAIVHTLGCSRASELRFDEAGVMQFVVWREHGGPSVSPPTRRGFGSFLLERTLAQDLDGRVTTEFRPEGLVCSIDAPLPTSGGSLH